MARAMPAPPGPAADPVPKYEGMWFNHQAMRRDFVEVQKALDAANPSLAWQCDNLALYLAVHLEAVHGHHTIEDNYFFPWVEKKAPVPRKLGEDHVALAATIAALEAQVKALRATGAARLDLGGRAAALSAIREIWPKYAADIRTHLDFEEEHVWALLREHFTGREMAAFVDHLLKTGIKAEFAAAEFKADVRFGWMLSSDVEHAPEFLAALPLPPRVLYNNFWGPAWSRKFAPLLRSIYDASVPSPHTAGGCCVIA